MFLKWPKLKVFEHFLKFWHIVRRTSATAAACCFKHHSVTRFPAAINMRRASVETIEKLVQSKADQARERRVSLTIMNCIWARNTERETTHPVHGEVIGEFQFLI